MGRRWTWMLVAAVFGAATSALADGGADRTDGQATYQRYCATCHGARGDGEGPSARHLEGPPPRDFTLGVYEFRSTPPKSLPTEKDLMRAIWRGVPGTSMPAWGSVLGREPIRDVARYIQGFSPKFAAAQKEGEPPEIVPVPTTAPPPAPESIARGRSLFLLLKCWDCHGTGGQGDGPSANKLEDLKKRRIVPRDFTRGPFKNGSRPFDIYRTLATGLDGTPMASYFDNSMAMLGPLVVQPEQFRADLRKIEPTLEAADLGALRRFTEGLPSADRIASMTEADRAKLLEGWRWDLVHYVRSLSEGGSFWRSVLGL